MNETLEKDIEKALRKKTVGVLFLILFIGALVVTMRNRRIIRRHSDYKQIE